MCATSTARTPPTKPAVEAIVPDADKQFLSGSVVEVLVPDGKWAMLQNPRMDDNRSRTCVFPLPCVPDACELQNFPIELLRRGQTPKCMGKSAVG